MLNRRALAVLVAVAALAGCSSSSPAPSPRLPNGAPRPAPAAPPCHLTRSSGHMGACAPVSATSLLLPPPAALSRPGSARFVDLSNNDPVDLAGMRAIKRRGYVGVVVKLNQADFIDGDAGHMVRDARRVGLAVGGYGFADPTRADVATDARIMLGRARALHLCSGRGVHPLTADLEYGSIDAAAAETYVAIVRHACGRVQVYTGAWYANPHWGCRWPRGTPGWISAYGVASVFPYKPCGLPARLLYEHQYTDHEFDGAVAGDASSFLGGLAAWRAYVRAGPPPLAAPSRAQLDECVTLGRYRRRRSRRGRELAGDYRASLAADRVSCTPRPRRLAPAPSPPAAEPSAYGSCRRLSAWRRAGRPHAGRRAAERRRRALRRSRRSCSPSPHRY